MLGEGNMGSTLLMLLLVAVAAICDLCSRKIPNSLIIAGLVIGLGVAYLDSGTDGLVMSLAGFGVGFILVLPGFLLRFTGAGDLKLLATLGIYSGPVTILMIFAASVVIGAVFILSNILWRVLARRDFFCWQYTALPQAEQIPTCTEHRLSERHSMLKQRLPMAPFYALGCSSIFIIQLFEKGV
jgi:prepilin peptidase CpaA